MERAALPQRVSQNVSGAITASGLSIPSVAQAADLTVSELTARLTGAADFNITELVQVGGFLRIRPSEFLGEAA